MNDSFIDDNDVKNFVDSLGKGNEVSLFRNEEYEKSQADKRSKYSSTGIMGDDKITISESPYR